MAQIIFILLDGLCAKTVVESMPFLHKGCIENKGQYGTFITENPPLSRPVYATLFTGLSPQQTGIVSNETWQFPLPLLHNSFLAKMHQAGHVCAFAAYHWMYELYMGEKFLPTKHRMYFSAQEKVIQHGIFYSEDTYPDSHVFQDAVFLQQQYSPDFLCIHTMNIDDTGHKHGGHSTAYALAAHKVDALLAKHIPLWLEQKAIVVVTSDHGMDATGKHTQMSPPVCSVPYAIFFPQHLQDRQGNICIQSHKDWYAWLCTHFSL